MIYKGWQILPSDYGTGYYEATYLEDEETPIKFSKTIEDLKQQIDEQ